MGVTRMWERLVRWVFAGLLALAVGGSASGQAFSSSRKLHDGFDGGLEGFALQSDHFGRAMVSGDFDGDGGDDLAIAELESLTGQEEGAVHVLYSGPQGLSTASDVLFKDYDPATGQSDREIGDQFGFALAVGDFNGDTFADLAIGIPNEDVGFLVDAGAVLIIYGSAGGLLTGEGTLPQRFDLSDVGFGNFAPHSGDLFSYALAAGDFNADGADDLAIGCPACDSRAGVPLDSGAAFVLYGAATGLTTASFRYLDQDVNDADGSQMANSCEVDDFFAQSLAAGDFDHNGAADLVIGVASETIATFTDAGAVHVVYGTPGVGLRVAGNQFWTEANVATAGATESGDFFGLTLATGDVTGEGVDDLVIGAPYEDVLGFLDAGAVTLLWGQAGTGLATPGSELYDAASLGSGATADFEKLGASLDIGDFIPAQAAGRADLAIGIPGRGALDPETLTVLPLAGAVALVPGGFGLDPLSTQFRGLGQGGSAGAADLDVSNLFGSAIEAADFDGNGMVDLAISAPGVDGRFAPDVTTADAGAVYVLYSSFFADGFESGSLSAWSATGP